LEWEPRRGALEGLLLKLEHINLWESGGSQPSGGLEEFRAIVNYRLPLL